MKATRATKARQHSQQVTDTSSSSQQSRLRVRQSTYSRPSFSYRDDETVTEDPPVGPIGHPFLEPGAPIPPEDQVKGLTEADLKEEFTRILTANNPHAPQNIIRFDFTEKTYKTLPSIDQLAVHFSLSGNLVHIESEEGKRQLALGGDEDHDDEEERAATETVSEAGSKEKSTVSEASGVDDEAASKAEGDEGKEEGEEGDGEEGGKGDREEGGEGDNEEGGAEDEEGLTAPKKKGHKRRGEKKLTNQFNFSERASQTYNNAVRERGTMTEPPPRMTFSDNVSQWEIYDAYMEDMRKQEKAKEKEHKKTTGGKKAEGGKKKATTSDLTGEDVSALIGPSARILERMVNQNTFDEITLDFKYYEDGADEFRDQEGTLLPLWKFSCDKGKRLAVTCLAWNPRYSDLFAVGHGSYDFMKQANGLILLYTMKNPSFPEYIFPTESGVMCIDIHPTKPFLVAVGFYDGNVAVYNMVEERQTPAYISSAKNGKHIDPVWEVRWQKEDLDNNSNFFSLSSDGRVTSWTLVKNELFYRDVIHLQLSGVSSTGPDGTLLTTLGGGTTFDFHRERENIFLVGTEEGHVHICSKSYSTTFIDTYQSAHQMAVYRVAWNHYHPKVFITCSADWTIKIWDRTTESKEPVFTFDLGGAVSDVAWAPYSSTVFAAVTCDGKVHVFDLNVNKYESICEQLVTPKKKTKLTHVAFNDKYPVLIVGDNRGTVLSLKLSPNLRKKPKEKKAVQQEPLKPEELEAQRLLFENQKLEKLLSMIRQPGHAKSNTAVGKQAKKSDDH